MRLFIFFCVIVTFVEANVKTIPKESYLTYEAFKIEQALKDEKTIIRPPDNWVELKATPPLLKKYSVDDVTQLSISTFEGNIGDDLSNINRWRSQLRLSPITQSSIAEHLNRELINDFLVKVIAITDGQQSFLIYWFTIKKKHIFVKITSSNKILKQSFDLFVENQPWDLL